MLKKSPCGCWNKPAKINDSAGINVAFNTELGTG